MLSSVAGRAPASWLARAAGFACAALLCGPAAAFAAPPTVHVVPIDPAAEARLLEDAGAAETFPVRGFTSIPKKSGAEFPTAAAVYAGAKDLIVVMDAEQPGVALTNSQRTNGVGFGLDDFLAVGIDTSGNGARVYYFAVTPGGVRYQMASESTRYNPLWSAQTSVGQARWRAVMRIPLAALRYTGSSTAGWRFNFLRSVVARSDHYTWAYDVTMGDNPPWPDFSDFRFWPYADPVKIASGAHERPNLAVYSLATAGADRDVFQAAGNTFVRQSPRHLGMDLSYPVTSGLNVVATLNPDFSNVELDQTISTPLEFTQRLTEYRPFFAQGANFFNRNRANINGDVLFYTPSIGPFDRGAKLEGTLGKQAIGLMTVQGAGFTDSALSLAQQTPNQSFRWWFDAVNADHRDGNLTAYGAAARDFSYEAGAAFRNVNSGLFYGFNSAVDTGTLVPDASKARDSTAFFDVHHANYETYVAYTNSGPYYGPIDGITNDNDIRGPAFDLQLKGTTPGLKSMSAELNVDRYVDLSGAVKQADAVLLLDAYTTRQVHANLTYADGILRTYDDAYPRYTAPVDNRFLLTTLTLGLFDASPNPTVIGYAWGPFGNAFVNEWTSKIGRHVGHGLDVSAELDETKQHRFGGPVLAQSLLRLSTSYSTGKDSNLSLAWRDVSGAGGFARPGKNLSGGYHRRFNRNVDTFLTFGSPAAIDTIQRVALKIVFGSGI